MFNTSKFQIIGRIGSITHKENVTYVSIASDRKTKDENGKWQTEANWNTVTVFTKALRDRLKNPKAGRHGNLLIVEGSIQSSSYMKDDEKTYKTTLAAQELDILQFAKEAE